MFCSDNCRSEMYNQLINIKKTGNRIITRLIGRMNDWLGDDFDGIFNVDLSRFNKSIFDFDWSNKDDPNYEKNLATCFLSLPHVTSGPSASPKILRPDSSDLGDLVTSIFLKNHRPIVYNSDQISCIDASYLGLFAGLINPSCLNNVELFNVDDQVAAMVCKPIKAGEQLFVSTKYSSSLKDQDLECHCRRCTDPNYVHIEIPNYGKFGVTIGKNFAFAKQLLDEGCRILNEKSVSRVDALIYQQRIYQIMMLQAYHCTFPC